MELLKQGGFFMIPLFVCSVLMVAIVADRFAVFLRIMKTPLVGYDEPDRMVQTLRQRMIALYTIIVISPMLGLIGTVIGLMRSFHLLGSQQAITDPVIISRGISEALITTATGLIITVIATIFYNYLTARLESYIQDYNAALKGAGKQHD
jgi:biopolymer transport protein ExbB/TolQ